MTKHFGTHQWSTRTVVVLIAAIAFVLVAGGVIAGLGQGRRDFGSDLQLHPDRQPPASHRYRGPGI